VRGRLLIVLSVVVVLLVSAATFLALWGNGPHSTRSGVVTVNRAGLHPGHARAITVALSDKKHTKARIFVVRQHLNQVAVFLGVSTHLGCRLLLPGDPGYGEGFSVSRRFMFEDPCGGSVFALNGDCVGGPCPRGLDRYPLDVRDDTAKVDLNHLIKGPPRASATSS